MQLVTRVLYNIVFTFFAIFYLPAFFAKGKHRAGFLSRFGRVPDKIKKDLSGQNAIWLHAVSAGEAALALRLAALLRLRLPRSKFIFTCTTPAGLEVLQRSAEPGDATLYFPIDFPCCVRAFLDAVVPSALIVLETEIWPNLLWAAKKRGIPVFLANARLSDRAFRKYACIRPMMASILPVFTSIWAQNDLMRRRFVELGAPECTTLTLGNLKYDWRAPDVVDPFVPRMDESLRRRGLSLFVAGSTHEGEEELLFSLAADWAARYPDWRILIAPRHLNRLEAIEARARKVGCPTGRTAEADPAQWEAGSVYLLDRMGVLGALYRVSEIVFVGGSLVDVGGHNLVEPATFEKSILFGPFMHNFKEMAEDFVSASAAVRVKDPLEWKEKASELAGNAALRREMGLRAKALVKRHEGAAERCAEAFLTVYSKTGK